MRCTDTGTSGRSDVGQACTSTDSCKSGLACDAGICRALCDDDRQCPKTARCTNNLCEEVPEAQRTCSQDTQCTGPAPVCHVVIGAQCWGAQCVFPNAAADTVCIDGNDCTTDDRCDGNGTCHGAKVTCNSPPNACLPGDMFQSYLTPGTCNKLSGLCDYQPNGQPVSCYHCALLSRTLLARALY